MHVCLRLGASVPEERENIFTSSWGSVRYDVNMSRNGGILMPPRACSRTNEAGEGFSIERAARDVLALLG
jgi:hypothetical protein